MLYGVLREDVYGRSRISRTTCPGFPNGPCVSPLSRMTTPAAFPSVTRNSLLAFHVLRCPGCNRASFGACLSDLTTTHVNWVASISRVCDASAVISAVGVAGDVGGLGSTGGGIMGLGAGKAGTEI